MHHRSTLWTQGHEAYHVAVSHVSLSVTCRFFGSRVVLTNEMTTFRCAMLLFHLALCLLSISFCLDLKTTFLHLSELLTFRRVPDRVVISRDRESAISIVPNCRVRLIERTIPPQGRAGPFAHHGSIQVATARLRNLFGRRHAHGGCQ